MKPLVLAETLRSIADKIDRAKNPSLSAVASDLTLAMDSVRLAAECDLDDVTEEDFRSAFQFAATEEFEKLFKDDCYPVTVDTLWTTFRESLDTKKDKKLAKKILKALDL